jgi:lipid-binding SYLF domain-containing protein
MKAYLLCGSSLLLLMLSGCSTAPRSQADREILEKEANVTIDKFKAADPGLQGFIDHAAGYAVFPSIGKGGWVLGGAYGRGILYEQRPGGAVATGYLDTTHATIGLQWGGQTFSEIVCLETGEAVSNLKYGKVKISGSVSAVAAKAGASAAAHYSDSVAVFTMSEAGLMLEGAVGGQKFGFLPK